MAAKQSLPTTELDAQMFESLYETKHKKKIALIGPAIDRLATHVRWGSRLSSSFYRTVGLNISLRKVTKTTPTSKASFDFVIWQFSPSLSPSLLKSLIRGASAMIVACYDTPQKTSNADSAFKHNNEHDGNHDSVSQKHFFAADDSCKTSANNGLDIALIEKSAKHLKLPIAFIHFVEDESDKQLAGLPQKQARQLSAQNQDLIASETELIKLGETEHCLHIGIKSDQDSEYCLGQAFDYIAGHFVSAA